MKRLAPLLLLAGLLTAQEMGDEMEARVSFEKDVLPLLTERCSKCHSAEFKGRKRKWKAGLRLDGKDFILRGGQSGPAVVPGKPDESLLWKNISLPDDHEDVMPPSGEVFEKDELALIRRWIEQGADFGAWTGKAAPKATKAKPETGRKPVVTGPDRYAIYRKLAEGLPAAPATAIAALEQAGARVEPVMPGSRLLRVEFLADPDRVDDKSLKALAPLRRHIGMLGLGATRVTDKSIAEIIRLPKLVRLDLQRTGLTDKGLLQLAKGAPPHLRRLNLSSPAVTDSGVTALAAMRQLKTVYLWQTRASTAGARMLRGNLPDCRVVFDRPLPAAEARRKKN